MLVRPGAPHDRTLPGQGADIERAARRERSFISMTPRAGQSFLHAKMWVVNREEHHGDPLAPDDLALIFVALTREFVGRVEPKTTFLDPMPSDPPTSGRALSGDLLGDVQDWTSSMTWTSL